MVDVTYGNFVLRSNRYFCGQTQRGDMSWFSIEEALYCVGDTAMINPVRGFE